MSSSKSTAAGASASEFTVESPDIIRLVLGFLTAQGLHQSADVLRQESGVGLRGLLNPGLPDHVRRGDWGNVLKALNLSESSYPLIQEQVILELAEQEETTPLAYSVLKVARDALDKLTEQDEKQTLSKARSLEQRLAAIVGNPAKYADVNQERIQLLYGKTPKQQRRNQLAKDLEQLPQIPLNRLPTLIQQACKWQSHTGQLPWIKELIDDNNNLDNSQKGKRRKKKKRKHLDLVLGMAAGDTNVVVGESAVDGGDYDDGDEDAEPVPQDILCKVKFGKSAVCESALMYQKGLITGSSDGLIEVWDSTYLELNTQDYPYQKDNVMGHTDTPILCLSLSNDTELLASGDATGRVKIWKLASGKCLRQYQAHNQSVTCLALSRDSSRLLTGSSDGMCREFGLVTKHVLQEYNGHSSYIHSCQYVLHLGENTAYVVTSSADGTVRLWQKGLSLRIFQPKPGVQSTVVDPTGILSESPALHTVVTVPNSSNLLLIPRSSTAYLVDWQGSVLQRYQADAEDAVFTAACVSSAWVYLVTDKHCLVFDLKKGTLHQTIRDFCIDSTSKTTGSMTAELTQLLHHPYKPILAAFSNDHTQKKGVLTVWK